METNSPYIKRPFQQSSTHTPSLLLFGLIWLSIFSSSAWPQDTSSPPPLSFQQATTDYEYEFPRDHGSHDMFQTEWWYFTGHLTTTEGQNFGYELTFFRRAINNKHVMANPSRWAIRQLYLAHFSLTDVQDRDFHFAEKISRAGLGKAGAKTSTLNTWVDQWSVNATSEKQHEFQLHADTDTFAIDLVTTSQKPPIIHGSDGISKKGKASTYASHYYSLTRLMTKGTLQVKGETYDVTGISWMDHEFASSDLEDGLIGWDWFSLQLNSNHEIMLYGLRQKDGTFASASSGTLVFPDGTSQHLTRQDVSFSIGEHWTSPKSGARYPNQWSLKILPHNIRLRVTPVMADQELRTTKSTQVTYWEGAVKVSGTFASQPVTGKGYVELTGYATPYSPGS